MSKRFFFILIALMAVAAVAATSAVTGSFMDLRDGKKYKTVKIGNQTWMAENLNFKTQDSYCYEDNESKCSKYGRLYKWQVALKACPAGWHLPSEKEFGVLLDVVGGDSIAGEALDFTSNRRLGLGDFPDLTYVFDLDSLLTYEFSTKTLWSFSFGLDRAGYRRDDGIYFVGEEEAFFWCSEEESSYEAWYMGLRIYGSVELDYKPKYYAYSVRCIKD
ncbi:major paralogous domain-containing protein [Fibrobacter sp. UWR3]|uniref:fibrobacter succinogenes major paralogous domain-containing protein n=1 Tax=Fibrobacter sp. UWR3 TaxID=1896217 RepID=UPI00091141E2|nr:fibrobacter succinogenes major paralogous domain-containing protein [Fibrobacter sp. UWR3]SHM39754.1 major paralogous domain-containing protein [Fibrobacter sp. UWR3]